MHVSDYGRDGPAQRFILERVDLLLARLESLGRQIRDTVARIVGTTVAEAVAEMIRGVTRYLPGRRFQRPRIYDEYEYDAGYDPFASDDDSYGDPSPARRVVRVTSTKSGRCRQILEAMAKIVLRCAWRVKHLRWPDHAVWLAGASTLLLWAADDAGSAGVEAHSQVISPGRSV